MAVGTTPTVCVNELVSAMKQRLIDDGLDPNNVDLPEVKPNFEALGKAIFQILTDDAEVVSDSTSDSPFWSWVTTVNATVNALAAWQSSVAQQAAAWTAAGSEAGIKTALSGTVTHNPAPTPTAARSAVR